MYKDEKYGFRALGHAIKEARESWGSRIPKSGSVEGACYIRGRIHPKVSDACPTKAFCTDKALRPAFFPQ